MESLVSTISLHIYRFLQYLKSSDFKLPTFFLRISNLNEYVRDNSREFQYWNKNYVQKHAIIQILRQFQIHFCSVLTNRLLISPLLPGEYNTRKTFVRRDFPQYSCYYDSEFWTGAISHNKYTTLDSGYSIILNIWTYSLPCSSTNYLATYSLLWNETDYIISICTIVSSLRLHRFHQQQLLSLIAKLKISVIYNLGNNYLLARTKNILSRIW